MEHRKLMNMKNIRNRGNSSMPIILIVAGLFLSAAVFFLFTKKRIDEKRAAEVASTTEAPEAVTPKKAAPELEKPKPPTPAPAPAPPVGYTGPEDMGKQLAGKLKTGDMAAAAKIIAGDDAAQEAALKPVLEKLKEMGYKVADPSQVQIIGQMGSATRLSIPLLKADGTPAGSNLELEMEKDAKMGVKITKLQLPKELESALATMPATAVKSLVVFESQADALAVAHRFLQALINLDYDAARKLVNEEKVPPVKLAGLCMVFEEGQYKLNQNKPLLVTVATDTTSWVIANVHSPLTKEVTEFGLEMEKQGAGWRVMGLNLSKLLADNAKASMIGDVPYTPLIQNPKGGDAIALYFEYDSVTLHPRTQKQLNIVANILKASPTKKLKISGHTDALGTETYNMALSQKRADTVKQFFLSQGLPLTQVITVGFGRSQPLSPNANPDGSDNPSGRSKNRRAEILLDF